MGHEISQFDIPGLQKLATNAQPRVGMWTDIGEAKITHTIFGRAKVRVIRKQDKKRRSWLLIGLAVISTAAAVWQGWSVSQQTEPLAAPPLSATVRVSTPIFQPEYIPPTATPPSVKSKPDSPPQIEINKPATGQKSAPQQPLGLKAPEQTAAKPVTQPLIASKPQAASLATNNNSSMNQTGMQQPPKLPAPIQPVTTIVATPHATQPEANSPAAVAPLVAPLVEEDTATQSPAGDNQPPDPVNAQP